MAARTRKEPITPEFEPADYLAFLTRLQYTCIALTGAASVIFVAVSVAAITLWDRPFPRGCMLIIWKDMLWVAGLAGIAGLIARSGLIAIEHQPLAKATFNFMIALSLGLLFYAALWGANAYYVFDVFASCRVADIRSEPCNLKTEDASVNQLIRISNLLEDLRAWPFENPNEWKANPGTRNR